MTKFEDEYKNLNQAQQKAVREIEGPVLVVAGPGTGKTQLLGMRVANILRQTDAGPSNILCLTFTNKAATNMRERLYRLIGPAGRNVVVRTFHSFAAEIMNTYPDHFWSGARLSAAPDAVQLEIIQNVLSTLPLDNPLSSTFNGTYTQLSAVKEALKLVKEAGLTPDELRTAINHNIEYIDKIEPLVVEALAPTLSSKNLAKLQEAIDALPEQEVDNPDLILPLSTVLREGLAFAIAKDDDTGKTANCGKWKRELLQNIDGQKSMGKERSRCAWWLTLAGVYETYRQQLHLRGYYDYSDMLVEVITQLERDAEMRADIQERFLYVMIDEFQDTNAAQLRLSHLVADHYAANNRPNIMAVGDDDQSIFAFNGAELSNVLGFRRSYPSTKMIVLTENYRSAQAILDASKAIIDLAEDRLVKREPNISKDLIAKNEPDNKPLIEHLSYPTRQHQQLAVAKRVKEIWEQGDGDIAVLARRHDSLEQLAGILHEEKVPVIYERQSNVLEHEAVRQVYQIAQAAVAIAEGDKNRVNILLSHILREPMWEITPLTLWRLAVANYSHPDWLASLLDHPDEKLQNIGLWLVWLSRSSQSQPVTISLEYIMGLREGQYLLSPFRQFYFKDREVTSSYIETLSAVEILRSLSREFASAEEATLKDFARFIELNLSTNRVIADSSWFMSGQKAVHLLTVHAAKGLEFDNVFIIDAVEDMWKPKVTSQRSPANLRLQSYFDKSDDFVRLLYVAATRAKRSLIATSFFTNEKGEEVLPTPLLSALPAKIIKEPEQSPIEVLQSDLKWPELDSKDETAVLSQRLDNFFLSPTSLLDFLDVADAGPNSFKERHLLRLPTAHSPQGSYGTAIHAALETAQRLVNAGTFELSTVLDRFGSTLAEQHMLPIEFDRYKQKGEALLNNLFESNLIQLPKGGSSELKLRDIYIGEARLGGNLDSVYSPDKDSLLITDFKTGKPLSSFETKDQTKAIKAWRHKTQLIFYCLLAQNFSIYKSIKNFSSQIAYVEAEQGSKIYLPFSPSQDEINRLAKLAGAVWSHITNLRFPDISKYSEDIAGIEQFEQDLIDKAI